MGLELAAVTLPEFQPKKDVMIATDDTADTKMAMSNGVDDQKAIESLVERLQADPYPSYHTPASQHLQRNIIHLLPPVADDSQPFSSGFATCPAAEILLSYYCQ